MSDLLDIAYYTQELQAQGIMGDTAKLPDGSIELRMPEGSTAEQIAAGQAALDAIIAAAPLKRAKIIKLAQLDAWYYQATQSGVTVSGITIDATIESQNRIDALVTMILAALTVGAADATTTFTAYDINGSPITLPAGQLMGLMLQYGQAAADLSATYASTKVAILSVSTLEELSEIDIPD